MQNKKSLNHLAIIMDGNGRWALNQDLPRTAGHAAGEHFQGNRLGNRE